VADDDEGQGGEAGQDDDGRTDDQRLKAVEDEQRNQGTMLQKILDKLSGAAPAAPEGAQEVTAARLGGPVDVAEEVRREMARAQTEQAAQATEAEIQRRLAELEARPPRDPERRVTRVMFGRADG
jgi:hypothetical protein